MFSQKSKGLQTILTETVSDWFPQNKKQVSRMTWDSSPSVATEELPTQHAFSSPTSPTRPEKTVGNRSEEAWSAVSDRTSGRSAFIGGAKKALKA